MWSLFLINKILIVITVALVLFATNAADASYPDTSIRTITVGSGPTSLALTTAHIFVANSLDDTVSVIDRNSYLVTDTIDVGQKPEHIIASSDYSKVYVANYDDDSISVITVSTLTVTKTITGIGDGPRGMCLSVTGDKLYVACSLDDSVAVISTASDAKVTSIGAVGDAPYGLAATTDGYYLYVTLNAESTVAIIDLTTNSVTDTKVAVGSAPDGIAALPNGNYIYTANTSSDSLSQVSTSSKRVANTISNAGDGVSSIAVLSTGEYAIVTNSNSSNVSVVSTLDNTVVDTITVESSPSGIVRSEDDKYLFIANRGGNSVTQLEDQAHVVIDSVDKHYLNNTMTAQIVWQTTDAGDYQVEVGGDGTKGNGDIIEGPAAVTAGTPVTTDVAAADIIGGDGVYKIYIYVTLPDTTVYKNHTRLVLDNSLPAVPTGVTSTFGDESITLSWDETTESDLEGYNIHYGTTIGVYTTTVPVGAVSSHTLTGLTNGTTYYIVITAVDITGNESANSTEVSNTPDKILGLSELVGENSCFIATASYRQKNGSGLSDIMMRLIDMIAGGRR